MNANTSHLVRSAEPDDAKAITAIYNQGIANRTATFETRARRVEEIEEWLAHSHRWPVLVSQLNGEVVGWAALKEYRSRQCYAGIAEFSIYVDECHQGKGLGKPLLDQLLVTARSKGFWKVLSRIFTFNNASLALCKACGFRQVGTYQNHANLDGRWLDVVIVEKLFLENQT
ncbi:arsinothricin resistance N-acetyltransferase ArsN1 family A [Microbulbifer yueqingensis]|uniref:Phosphinothricin acetyltransferase n=1 Tax=Microbulbifer yueqingensis TaxID=658219 RepID=A0A1G9CKI8_9GAMM|nr:arsinothricin resistance N-acetyltransferase ArsN1 family A [Microbulbifer yueqingensis]SDK52138.1 phosphinothricin acetyltransferase [Microbulbifer yueqingensis]